MSSNRPLLNRRQVLVGLSAGLFSFSIRPVRAAPGWQAAINYHRDNGGSALLITLNGKTVVKDGDDAPHELASGTKSFWGTLALVLEQQGKLSLDDTLGPVIPEWSKDLRGQIRLRQLLTLSSGLDGGGKGQRTLGKVPTFEKAIAESEQSDPAGQVFHYGPYPFQVFGEYLRRRFQTDPLELAHKHVFAPAQMTYSHWRRGDDGQIHLPSGAYLNSAQWTSFGKWVMANRKALQALFQGTSANPAYGLTWWLNRPVPAAVESHLNKNMRTLTHLSEDPKLPKNIFLAAGLGDQRLLLFPDLDLIVARQAGNIMGRLARRETDWSDLEFLRLLMQGLR